MKRRRRAHPSKESAFLSRHRRRLGFAFIYIFMDSPVESNSNAICFAWGVDLD